ncbi:hypothetical protein L1987_06441 [Smallanthus sonchifolius]|uniref:Uncharacterized protein n=1 Tax=Smallanthus sonchifolius TaxID=185202 RepID=A0ACB9JY67_9ASTR|nr:hypothetical protein L1987_06441 [Smallanthus sonchifolius]
MLRSLGVLVIATPYASGFDHFFIADELQFKYDKCARSSIFWHWTFSRICHPSFDCMVVTLFSHVLLPMAQSIGPILSQIASSPTARFGIREGLCYNPYFLGGAIAMPKILNDGVVEYEDGTRNRGLGLMIALILVDLIVYEFCGKFPF